MKRKEINYNLLDSSLNYRLNDKKIYISILGTKLIKSNLDISLDLIINDDYLATNSLAIELEKNDISSYTIKYPNGNNDKLDVLYYILDDSNERMYADKENVIIKPDGSLEYNGHEVKTYFKSDSGLSLYGDFNDFIDSDKIDLKNEEISKLEQEIFNIESLISEIEYKKVEYSKLDDIKYIEYDNALRQVEQLNLDLASLQVSSNDDLYSYYNAYYDYKHMYYNNTRKTLDVAYGLVGGATEPVPNSGVQQYLYTNSNGRNMQLYNSLALYYDDDGDADMFDDMTISAKIAKYYEQEFTKNIEYYNSLISQKTDEIENKEWYHKKIINQKTKEIKNANATLLNKKAIYENEYNALLKDYYHECLIQFDKQLEYYNKLLKQKKYQLSKYQKEIPIIYLITADRKLVYGFNECNKLCCIFDSYNHQLLIEYKNDKIISVIDEKGNKIELSYNELNQLTNIRNDVGEYVNINYSDNKIARVDKNENSIYFEYNDGLLNKISDESIGYKLHYSDDDLDVVSKVSKDNHIKELHNYLYDNNLVTLIDKTRYELVDDNYIYSKIEYIFEDTSLISEIEYRNNTIHKLSGYEYDSYHCDFAFESNKNDKKIFESEEESFLGVKVYNVTLTNILKTDYTLYALVSANSLANIYKYRKTAYCNHLVNVSNIKYELRVALSYPNEEITYGSSFNPSITGKQIVAIPVTLKEDSNGKAIQPDSMTVYIDYSNNNGECTVYNVVLSECKYSYRSCNSAKQPLELYVSDIKYPIISNSMKTGYIIKSSHVDYSYDIKELLKEEKEYISYEKYDLNNNYIETTNKEYFKKYYYDNKSRLIRVVDSKSNTKIYEYDDNGNVIKDVSYNEKDSSNVIIKDYEYDSDGNLISDSNELGYKSKYQHSLNDVLEESPNGFITRNSESYLKTDLISNSRYINKGKIESLNSGDINYKYTYDEWGMESSLFINDNLYMNFIYDESLGKKYYVSKLNNNKGYMKVTDLYDKPLYIKKINNETQEIICKYEYDSNDNLISIKDKNDNILESYEYIDDVLSKISNDNYIKKYSNDIYGNTTSISYDNDTYNYQYNEDNELIGLSHNNFNEELKYDSLKRIINKDNNVIDESYEYLNINNRTTNLIKLIKQKINNRIIYNKFYYDKCGNIIKSIINHNETRYYYDGLNRLIRLDSNELNHTYTYSYDEKNNIISKGIHDLSDNNILLNSSYKDYEYDNDNKLISYDNNQITYDNSLRPINYKGNTLLWDNNKLLQYGNNHFEYDYNGLRIKKITSNEEIEYVRDGKRLLKEIHTVYNSSIIEGQSINNNIEAISSPGDVITYNYGINGIEGFTLNNINYHYIKNIFNDVIEIIDDNYNTYAKYSYDAYGECNIILNVNDIANINPIRYRSYYYDKEIGLYYLNNRYYDPEIMRFISLDDISYLEYDVLGGLNLWTYCNNNPIMYVDPDGNFFFSLTALIVGAIVGSSIAFGTVVYMDYKDDGQVFNGSIKWYDYLGATLLGGVIGAIAGVAVGGIAGMSFTATIPTIGFVNAGGVLSIGITGSVTLTVSGTQILTGVGLAGLGIMAIIPKHGAPNTKIKDGGSFGEYDENGNLSYRVDTTGKPHYIKSEKRYALPHIHKFTWKLVNGVWRYIEEVLSYFL